MKDRIPTKVLPNGAVRYGVYNDSGALVGYQYMKLEDEPTEVGTALNKNTLLSDAAANALQITDEALKTPSGSIENIGNRLSKKIDTGRTISTSMEGLQSAINGIPKLLNQDITINVSPGTLSTGVTIRGFFGCGLLRIQGSSSQADTTRILSRISIYDCANTRIEMIGFTTSTTSFDSVSIQHCPALVVIQHCNMVAGVSSTNTNNGVAVVSNPGLVRLADNLISSKNFAVTAQTGGRVFAQGNSGTGSLHAYYATTGGIIQIASGTMTGTNPRTVSSGGLVVTQSGGTVGI